MLPNGEGVVRIAAVIQGDEIAALEIVTQKP